jgi:hypothetical protein
MPWSRGLGHRLDNLEQFAEQQRRPIRERVEQIVNRLGVQLAPIELASIVARHVGTPARIRVLLGQGLTGEQIVDHLFSELGAEGAV